MLFSPSASELNKKIEFLNKISAFDVLLFGPGTEEAFSGDAYKQRFKDLRYEWHKLVQKSQIGIARFLIDELERNQDAFEAGISYLEQQIQQLNDDVAFLELLDNTLKLVSRIVVLP